MNLKRGGMHNIYPCFSNITQAGAVFVATFLMLLWEFNYYDKYIICQDFTVIIP